MDWQSLAQQFRQETNSHMSSGAYFGFEDAGYAYRAAGENSMALARLCEYLAESGISVPSWMNPEKITVADDVYVIESVWGWEVIPTPDGYWDENVWRTLKSTHTTRDEALEAAQNTVETLKDVENRQQSSVSAAQAYASSEPEARMVSFSVSSVSKKKEGTKMFSKFSRETLKWVGFLFVVMGLALLFPPGIIGRLAFTSAFLGIVVLIWNSLFSR